MFLGWAMNRLPLGPVRGPVSSWPVLAPLAGVTTVVLAVAAPTAALAADGQALGGSEATFVPDFGLLLLVGRLMGEAAQRIGQPAVMGQLVGGLLLGPCVLGLIWPAAQHALFPAAAD